MLAHLEQAEHVERDPLRAGDIPLSQGGVGQLAGGESVEQPGAKTGQKGAKSRSWYAVHQPPASGQHVRRQKECAIAAEDKGREQYQIAGGDQPADGLQGDREQAIEHGQRVKGQVDAQRVKEIVTVEGVGALPQ